MSIYWQVKRLLIFQILVLLLETEFLSIHIELFINSA